MNVVAMILRTVLRGGIYRGLGRLRWPVVAVAMVAAAVVLFYVEGASAAEYLTSCPTPANPITDTQAQCAALAERLAANTAALEAQTDADRSHSGFVVGAVVGTGFFAMVLGAAFGGRGA